MNSFVKIFSITSVATVVKMVTSLISTKIISVLIGTSGIALLGQLANFSTIIMNLSSAGINSGITKYVSEYKDDPEKIGRLISTSFTLTSLASVLAGIFMIAASHFLSSVIMLSNEYIYVFVIFGLTVFFYAVNNMLISIVNGFKKYKLYTLINISGSLLGLLFTVSFVFLLGLKGALISYVTYQSIVLCATLFFLRKELWLVKQNFVFSKDSYFLRKLAKYSVGSLVFVAITPVIQLILRGFVISNISSAEAGIWEGMNRVSAMYMMIINTSLSVYYIPRLSEIRTRGELKSEILAAYKIIIPFLLVGFSFIYFIRYYIIKIVFSTEFIPMGSLFSWQLLLDFINACSFVLSYIMIAKAMIKTYVITTVVFSLLYITFSYFFLVYQNSAVGIIWENIFSQILCLVTMVFIFRKTLFYKIGEVCK